MPSLFMGSTARYSWYLDYTLTQDVVTNQSTIAYTLRVQRTTSAANGSWWFTPARNFNVTIGGTSDTEGHANIDFRDIDHLDAVSGTKVITHNTDGTASNVSVSVGVSGNYVSSNFPIPTTFSGKSIGLPTILRAATAIFRSGWQTGTTNTLTISPVVDSFYYVLEYTSPENPSWTLIGSADGIVGTSWPYNAVVSHAEIPDATSGTITFRVTTLDGSGGTQIGDSFQYGFTYSVPSSVLPSVTAPTWTEGASTSGLSTLTNGGAVFCQGWSKLIPDFTATPGSGATIASALATVAGVSGNTTDGVAFSNVVTSQGSGSTFSVTAIDSRGRTDTETGTVSPSVHRWSLPTANAGSVVVTPTTSTQTIALSGLQATTTSFYLSGSQRNLLETRLGYRDLTTAGAWVFGSWTSQSLSSSDATNNAYAPGSPVTVATGLDPTHEYEVALRVRDKFGQSGVNYSNGLPYVESSILVPASNILVAFDGNDAVGIKKVPVNGVLDIGGTGYQDRTGGDSQRLLDYADIADIVAAAIAASVPPGVVVWTAGSTADTGYLMADGSAVSRTTYAALFARIGTTYGAGNGTTTFNVPNIKGRAVVARDSGQSEFDTLGETGGSKTHVHNLDDADAYARLTATNTHLYLNSRGTPSWTPDRRAALTSAGNSDAQSFGVELAGETDSGSSLAPYIVLNAQIKT